jgi:hypothetical protein
MDTNNGQVSGEGIRNPENLYERRDLSTRAIFGFLIALAIAGVLMHVVLWGLYKYMVRGYRQSTPVQANAIEESARELPQAVRNMPSPQLQPNPVADLNKFRVREEDALNSYGWVDQSAGVVHIPIEKAIEMVAQQGLPVRPQSGPPGAAAESAPGKSPSGKQPASKQ